MKKVFVTLSQAAFAFFPVSLKPDIYSKGVVM